MNSIINSEREDQLFNLLPAIYRERDAELGGPLQALLRVVTEQVNTIEDDLETLYKNWFIETCQDWVVPYLGDLVGYRNASPTGEALESNRELARQRWLVPRRDVANTVRSRRRKGTLAVLEELARDVAGWSARAVEGARLLGFEQSVNHLRLERGPTVNLHDMNALERLNSPFDQLAHTVAIRRPNSSLKPGWHNLPSVAVFVWRLRVYGVTHGQATCLEDIAPHCYTFSALGQDTALYTKLILETDPTQIATQDNLPVPISRRTLESQAERFVGSSFVIWRGQQDGAALKETQISSTQIVAADLRDWLAYRPRRGTVAVDPERGRIVFHPDDRPDGVWVSYHYGFPDDLGGGEYHRRLNIPSEASSTLFLSVGRTEKLQTIQAALEVWETIRLEKPQAIIEIVDSEVYRERLEITLATNERLTIRAADRTRPVIELTDRYRNRPDAFTVRGNKDHPGGCLVLEGLTITGRAMRLEGSLCAVDIRHSTLVPGWGLHHDCEPHRPSEPSLEIYDSSVVVCISHSIVGAIRVRQNEVRADPVQLCISDSIIDATSFDRPAISCVISPCAFVTLSLARSTVFGTVQVHAIELVENTIFTSPVRVARRQIGCLRFSFVPEGSRTPRQYRCQPETAVQTWLERMPTASDEAKRLECQRVQPLFESIRYGTPTYARLDLECPPEINCGADDESEMGVYHDLFEPQCTENLQMRLKEFVPAGFDVGIIKAS